MSSPAHAEFVPTGEGWYRHKHHRHYVEFRLIEGVLQIIMSHDAEMIKEFFGIELEEFLSVLRGEV